MPPPTTVPKSSKNSSQKSNKPPRVQASSPKIQEQDQKEKKKKRMSLVATMKEFGAKEPMMEEEQAADNVELPEAITFDEFRTMDILTDNGLREFCKKVADVRELEKAVAFLDEKNAALEKNIKAEKVALKLETDEFFLTENAIEKCEKKLEHSIERLEDSIETVESIRRLQTRLVKADSAVRVLTQTVKRSAQIETERILQIRNNGLVAMEAKTANLEDYLAYQKVIKGISMEKKPMTRNQMIVWLIEKSNSPSTEEPAKTIPPGEQNNNDSDQRAASSEIGKPEANAKKEKMIRQAISQESSGPETDHQMSDFSDISSTQSPNRETQEN